MGNRVPFDLIPAIDLRDGHVVRLRRGDFAAETAYTADPSGIALEFAAAGATWLHVVDLDGARSGEPQHLETIAGIVDVTAGLVRCEVAGGLRSLEHVAAALGSGAGRVVIGTAALRDPAFAAAIVATHGTGRLAVAIDVRDGLAIGEGWREGAPGVPAADAMTRLADAGVVTFEVTAINRDGLLEGPDLELLGRLARLSGSDVIASGGISSLDDLRAVADQGCVGAIVGRALYEGRIDLREAVELAATL